MRANLLIAVLVTFCAGCAVTGKALRGEKNDRTPPASSFAWGNLVRATGENVFVANGTHLNLSAQDAGLTASGVVRIEYRFDDGEWRKYDGPAIFASLPDGRHALSFRAVDRAGNAEPPHLLHVVSDNTPPVTTLAVDGPGSAGEGPILADAATRFLLRTTDALSGVVRTDCRIDDGPWQSCAPFPNLSEGKHVISFRSVDHLGNTERIRTAEILLDATPPETTITVGMPRQEKDGRLIAGTATTFDLAASDGGSGVSKTEYRVDNGPWLDSAPFRIDREGTHVIAFRSTDRLAHLEPEKQLVVTVDATPPETSLQIPAGSQVADGATYVGPATLIKLEAIDWGADVAATEYRLDEGPRRPYAPFAVPEPGKHVVAFRSVDGVGNREAEKQLALTVDATPPVTTLAVGAPHYEIGGFYYVNGNTALTLSASKPVGIARTEYRVDEGPWTSYAPFTLAAEGRHRLAFRSIDNLGNEEQEKSAVVNVDLTAPVSAIQTGAPRLDADGKLLVSGSTRFTITANDSFSGLERTEYRVDNGQWLSYLPFTLNTEGAHLIEYRAVDKAGNSEQPRALAVTVDLSAPATTLAMGDPKLESAGRTVIAEKTAINLSAEDNLAGIARIEYRLNDGPWKEYAPFTISAKGGHALEFRSVDRLGNVEEARLKVLEVDATPPLTTLQVAAPKFQDGAAMFVSDETLFTLAAGDPQAGVATTEYRLDDKEWTTAASFKVPDEGRHSVAFRSTDRFGNREEERTIQIVVDKTPPTTNISVEKKNGKPRVVVSAVDNLSGAAITEYRVDGGRWKPYGSFSLASAGRHVVDFRTIDQLGNAESEKSIAVFVGKVPSAASAAKGAGRPTVATSGATEAGQAVAAAGGAGTLPMQGGMPRNDTTNAVAKLLDDPQMRDSLRREMSGSPDEAAVVRVPRYIASTQPREALSDPLADGEKPDVAADSRTSGGGKVAAAKATGKDKSKRSQDNEERTSGSMMLSTFQLLSVLSLMVLL